MKRNFPQITSKTTPSWQRPILVGLGLIFVGIGMVGAVLPVMPTVPFLIIALMCFAKSSERLHNWLYNLPTFGPALQQWDRHRVIPRIVKIYTIAAMGFSMGFVIAFSQAPWYAIAAMGVVIVLVAGYVLSKPSQIPEP